SIPLSAASLRTDGGTDMPAGCGVGAAGAAGLASPGLDCPAAAAVRVAAAVFDSTLPDAAPPAPSCVCPIMAPPPPVPQCRATKAGGAGAGNLRCELQGMRGITRAVVAAAAPKASPSGATAFARRRRLLSRARTLGRRSAGRSASAKMAAFARGGVAHRLAATGAALLAAAGFLVDRRPGAPLGFL